MVGNILKTLQHLQQDFQSVSDQFGGLCVEGVYCVKRRYFT